MVNSFLRRNSSVMVSALPAAELSAPDYLTIQRWRQALLALTVLVACGGGAWLTIRFEALPPLILTLALLLSAICWRPRLGLYFILTMVLLFEAGGPDELMLPGRFFHYGLQSTMNISGFIASPMELLLLLTFTVWLAQGLARRNLGFRPGRLLWPVLFFYLAVIAGVARGGLAGGDMYIAFWEARALLYLLITYLIASSTIRTRAHVSAIMAILLVAVGLFSLEGAYRSLVLSHTTLADLSQEFLFTHDSVIFLGALLLLVLAQWVFRAPLWQRLFGLCVAPITLYTLLATQRRAGYIALMVAFLAYALIFLVTHRKAFFILVLPLLAIAAVYLPIFWNNTGLLGQPARAIRSLSEPDTRDAASNLYRQLEKINVAATIHSDPLLGVGFGRPFDFMVPLPDLSWWPFWKFEPHHNVLWVWLKTGAFGFILFWLLIGSALAVAAHTVRRSRIPEVRIFALLAVAGIIQILVFCYVDLGLVDGRVTVFLGTILGTLGVAEELT